MSDGGLNAGESPDTAEELARESHIPIYTVGVGSEKKPVDVRVAEFSVPSRVFPGDRFSVEGSIQGYGMKGQTVRVELLAREGAAAKDPSRRGQGRLVDSAEKILLGDGEAVPVKFELPPSELGHRVLCLRVKAPPRQLRRVRQIPGRRGGRLRPPDARAPPGRRSTPRLSVSPHAPLPRSNR